jgi:carbonic anhydrase
MSFRKTLALSTIAIIYIGVYTVASAATGAAWSYAGDTGPANWGSLSVDYELCGVGLRQSPVDLSLVSEEKLPKIEYEYNEVPLSIENNGHTIEVHYHAEGKIKIDESEYGLLQFHFHSPSEHTEGNTAAVMEAHFVHINSDSQLAVVGVLIDEGAANSVFEAIISNAPTSKGIVDVEGVNVSAFDLLPPQPAKYMTYSGSLTTPPCSESVRWMVLNERIEVSRDQIDRFLNIIGENARPVQFLNDRVIQKRK